nr:hypothetical protein [Bifidobacterium catenulatum]
MTQSQSDGLGRAEPARLHHGRFTIAGLVCLLLAAMTGTMPFILMIVQTHMAQTLTRQT